MALGPTATWVFRRDPTTTISSMLVLEANGVNAKDRIAAMKNLGDTYGHNKQVIETSTPDAYSRELKRLMGKPNDN